MRKFELLAPARNADIGIEAFRHGADAVYIGAGAFSARAAAGNSIEDIKRLAQFGHQYHAKTIVAFNTILRDDELQQAEELAWQLYDAGVDALIIQDLGVLGLHLPPIELHASTQTDNRTIEKVRLMHQLGMKRVVMARELSIEEIRAIHEACPDVELECFVHGALCVCISGQCYLSAAMTGRSANRGECAQPCRLPMDLTDADGRLIARQKHLLSLRDMNRQQQLEALMEAGVYSLKIEGRLKDVEYVKNVVASYRQQLDRIFDQHNSAHPDDPWCAASLGRCKYTFTPNVEKAFNRGFTPYFADGERRPMWNFETPKSIGERLGTIEQVGRDWFTVKTSADLHNGDGLAIGAMGFRLNRYDASSSRCFPLGGAEVCRHLSKGQEVRRNLDTAFEQLLSKPSATRRIPIRMSLTITPEQLTLTAGLASYCIGQPLEESKEQVVSGHSLNESVPSFSIKAAGPFDPAKTPQYDNFQRQLAKLGDSIFELAAPVQVKGDAFIPSSLLSQMRRDLCNGLQDTLLKLQTAERTAYVAPQYLDLARQCSGKGILPEDFHANVLNKNAREVFGMMGIANVDKAFEAQQDGQGTVMLTRHCLKYAFGRCPKYKNPTPEKLPVGMDKWKEPLTLQIGKRKFILNFGCKNDCISKIITIFASQNAK